jgi:hypothetical protein
MQHPSGYRLSDRDQAAARRTIRREHYDQIICREICGRCRCAGPDDARLAAAQDLVHSPYVGTGETGSVHIHLTPELTRQIQAERGVLPPAGALSYHGGPIMTGVNLYAIS